MTQNGALTDSSGPAFAEVAARAGMAACFVAVAAVPTLFDTRAERAFEEAKIIVLRSLAALGAAALLVWATENVSRWSQLASRLREARALLIAAAFLTATYLMATLSSIAPRIAWEGAYIRRQGTITFLSYLVVFLTAALFVRKLAQVRLLLLTVLLTSVFPTAYAISQHYGLDLTVWHNAAPERVTSTEGNAIFFGGYLIMVWPIAIAEIVRFDRHWLATMLLAGAQIAAIVFTGSVGVWVALAVETLVIVGIQLARMPRVRTRILVAAIAFAGVAVVGVLASARRPMSGATPSTLSRMAGRPSRSGEVRMLLWRTAVELLRAKPGRAVVGYGPDTIRLTLGRYDPVAVRRIEGPAIADRSHNGVLDTILTVGVVGLLAHTMLLGALCLYGLRHLGLVTSRKEAASLGLSVGLSLLASVVLSCWIDRRGGLLPLAWGAGLVVGLLVFVLLRGVRARQLLSWEPRTTSLAALLAAVVGHYVETQTGIATVTSELYFWLFAGLMAAVPAISPTISKDANVKADHATAALSNALVLGVTTGLLLAIMTFDFSARLVERPFVPPALFVVLVMVILGMSVALRRGADTGLSVQTRATSRRRARVVFFISCAGVWLAFLAVSPFWTRFRNDAGTLVGLFATLFTAWAVLAVSRHAPHVFMRAARIDWSWSRTLSVVSVTAVVFLAVRWNLNALRADELSHMGTVSASKGELACAESFYTRAALLEPKSDAYPARLGEMSLAAFRRSPRTQAVSLETASRAYLVAHQLNPLEPDHLLQLAAIQSFRASAEVPADERPRHLDEASRYLAMAAELAPRDPFVWNEWGKVRLLDGDFAGGATMFERSLALDDRSPDAHLFHADALLGAGQHDGALREYRAAQTLGLANPLPAISGRALTLVRLNRLKEAIDANTEALTIAPEDYTTRKNLALLYERVGDIGRAVSFAVAAAAVADASAKPAIESLIADLRTREGGHPPEIR